MAIREPSRRLRHGPLARVADRAGAEVDVAGQVEQRSTGAATKVSRRIVDAARQPELRSNVERPGHL
jgi:hypothetical protein